MKNIGLKIAQYNPCQLGDICEALHFLDKGQIGEFNKLTKNIIIVAYVWWKNINTIVRYNYNLYIDSYMSINKNN